MAKIWGTFDADTIVGTAEDDDFFGLSGNDVLRGGGGNDTLVSSGGGLVLIEGGEGDDDLFAEFENPGQVSMFGGPGNDLFGISVAAATVDAGAGDDIIGIRDVPAATLTLGEGADRIVLHPKPGATPLVVTDFQTGDGGDRITIPSGLLGWDGSTNPFTLGYYRMFQQGADTVLQWDQDGSAARFAMTDIVRFQNTKVGQFVAYNSLGWSPTACSRIPAPSRGRTAMTAMPGPPRQR